MKLKFKKVTMPIEEIKITSAFSRSMPRLCKLKTCMDFYRANGYFDRQIIIDSDKYLRDGYCAYLTAELFGLEEVKALMVSGVAEKGKPTTRSTANTTEFKYHVGDRVTSGGHTGQVIGINEGNAPISYLVDFDEPGVGCHNGNSIGVTVGRQGTSNNCLWRNEADLQPADAKSAPTKLYCIKGDAGWLTKGKTYDFDGGIVCYDNGQFRNRNDKSFDEWKRRNPDLSACLVPLVKRLAKVGEWIYVTTNNGGRVKAETIWKVTNVDAERIYLTNNYVCSLNNYLVLDGYTDEKANEKSPSDGSDRMGGAKWGY